MSRLADGDRFVFREVFALVYPPLLRFTRRALPDSPDADDAAQQTLIKLFFRAAQFDPGRDALTWIMTLAAYECRTVRTRARRRHALPAETPRGPPGGAAANPEDAAIEENLRAAASELVGTLRPEDCQTLKVFLGSGDARPEVPGATFRKRVQRALERLRLAWRMKHGAD